MDTAEATQRTGAALYHHWEPPGKLISIHLSYDAIERLLADAVRGLGLVRRRGAEVGGLLLGTAAAGEKRVVRIEDIVPVRCEYAFGPSYVLSDNDRQAFSAVLKEWEHSAGRPIYAVGFYRSHTRGGLALSDEDLALLVTYFADPCRVALLVKPSAIRSSAGGFFFWEDGKIHSESTYLEFALQKRPAAGRPDAPPLPAAETAPSDHRAAGAAESIPLPPFLRAPATEERGLRSWWQRRRKKEEAEAQPAPRAGEKKLAAGEPGENRARAPLWASRRVQIPLLACLLAVDAGLGFLAARRGEIPLPRAPRERDPYALSLLVLEYGNNLHLTWDRKAPAVAAARRAVLSITDGDQNRTLELTPAQLLNGSVIYRRIGERVTLRLEVFVGERRSVSEIWELGKSPSEPGPQPDGISEAGRPPRPAR